MSVSGIIIGGFWAASAVKVAGMTWDAFTATYSQFPDSGSGPPSGQTAAQLAENAAIPSASIPTSPKQALAHPLSTLSSMAQVGAEGTPGLIAQAAKWLSRLLP